MNQYDKGYFVCDVKNYTLLECALKEQMKISVEN